MNVELISVGTELLLGDITNTNTVYLSKELANIGINVFKHTTVGDNKERLLSAFDIAFANIDTVIVTGGLGPTDDDITKECAAQYFNRQFYLDNYSWEKIQNYVAKFNKNNVITSNNKKQALIPEGALILENFCGTAPGIILEDKGRTIILIPGPPREMCAMFEKSVRPYLETKSNKKFVSKYIRFYGIGESLLEEKIKDILDSQSNPTVALYAKTGEVLIRVTAAAQKKEEAEQLIKEKIAEIKAIVGEYIYLIGDETISASQSELNTVVANILKEKNITLAIAESLTGGYLTSLLVEKEGISKVLLESIVCYSNESKIRSLDVKKETLENYSAVSSQVAKEMVVGIAKKNSVDLAVATTGYADGENAGKVYIAISYLGEITVKECHFNGDRNRVRDRAAKEVLNEIRKLIK